MPRMNAEPTGPASQLIADLAQQHLQISTLEVRRVDSLDFHEVTVWQVRAALEAAYQAGLDAAKARGRAATRRRRSR